MDRALTMDTARLRAFVAAAPAAPTAGFVLPDEASPTHLVLRALLARRCLRRLSRVVVRRAAASLDAADRTLYQQCIDALLARSDAELEHACCEPELVSIAAIATDDEPRQTDPLAAELARALVPELMAAGIESLPFPLRPDVDGGFTLRRLGLRIVGATPDPTPAELRVRVAGGALQVLVDGLPRGLDDAPGLRVEQLPRLLDVGPHLSPAPTAWLASNVRDQLLVAIDRPAFARFHDAMRSGAELLARVWPAAWREVAAALRWLLPLPPGDGREPHNYSVHAFRGLVVTSPRRDHRCAQTLVHEAGHNRLSTILELLPLCMDPGRVVVSPVVRAERPLSFVFHGCFAFAQDIALTRRLLPTASAGVRASMARYLDETRCKASPALALLRREASLTAVGSTVVDEIAEVLER